MAEKVGFIGLGVMGGPMAAHLQAAGHDVTVYNRTREKAESWVDRQSDSNGMIREWLAQPSWRSC